VAEERQRILDLLEQQLFRPALDDNPDHHPPFRRDEIEAVRREIGRERDRLVGASSANAILLHLREAAHRSQATGLEARLEALGLPCFAAVRDEIEKLAAELGIPGRPEPASYPR
jgi:HAMP domain-containing protein